MTIFDQLEERLVASIRDGGIDLAEQPLSAARRVRPLRRVPVIACIAGLAVAGGALAATGVLPIGSPLDDPSTVPPVLPGDSPGRIETRTRVLPLRVADPTGGPPWALRTFHTDRGASCLQIGQAYRGRFGTVTADAAGAQTFRPLQALPGRNSLCGGVERAGIPVLRGLRKVVSVGGSTDQRRCNGSPCPITDVRVIRYGTLGPAARSATFINAAGKPVTSMRLSPKSGGAYLFVIPVPSGPYQRADERQQRHEVAPAISATRPRVDLRPHDGVEARFAGGIRLRVAGPGRFAGPLPGVTPRQNARPTASAPLRVTTQGTAARRRFVVSFRAPVAIRRFDHHYTLAVSGATGSTCQQTIGGYQATTRRIAKGMRVRFRITPAISGYDRVTWCPGAFTIRAAYRTPNEQSQVGAYHFTVPPK